MREQLKTKEKKKNTGIIDALERQKEHIDKDNVTSQGVNEIMLNAELSTLNDQINNTPSNPKSSAKNNTSSGKYSIPSSKKNPSEKEAHEASNVYVSGSPVLADDHIEPAQGISVPPPLLKLIEGQTGKGVQIEPGTLKEMNLFFEEDFSDVNVHTGQVSDLLCGMLNCYAFAFGKDIFFQSNHYAPETDGGKELLVHELTHVVQQRAQMPVVQLFEAPWHQRASRQGLDKNGFAQEEIRQIYFGNWMRDMNQVFVPALKDYGINDDVVLGIINYLAFKQFGKEVTAEQFGFYIPAEHIDNPAGQIKGMDLLSTGPQIATDSKVHTINSSTLPSTLKTQDTSSTIGGNNIFDVDSTGVMSFIRKTNVLVEKRLELAVNKGRTPEGRMHLGAAMHSMEDLFAHSNFAEIALNQLLQEDSTLLPNLQGTERGVNTLSPEVQLKTGKTRNVLTTGTFTGTDTIVSIGHEAVKFMREGLPTNVTKATNVRSQKLTQKLLDNFATKLNEDPNAIAMLEKEFGATVAFGVKRSSFNEIYRIMSYASNIVDLSIVTNFINGLINDIILKPAADQVESMVLETQVSNTTLAKSLEAQQAVIDSKGEIAVEEYLGNALEEQEYTAQRAAKRTSDATKRKSHLTGLPKQVLATASHSQLAKDHANSPLFALGFTLAAEADRRIGQKLLLTPQWNKQPEIKSTYDEELRKYSDQDVKNLSESKLESILKSYGMSSTKISSLSKAQKVENAIHFKAMVEDSKNQFDVSKNVNKYGQGVLTHVEKVSTQQEQASQTIDAIANAIEIISGKPHSDPKKEIKSAPQKGINALKHVKGMITEQEHQHGNSNLLLTRSKTYVTQAQKELGKVDKVLQSYQINRIIAFLRNDADAIKGATTLEAREKAYQDLRRHQQYYLDWAKTKKFTKPGMQDAHSMALLILNRAITSTAPSFTQGQLDAIAGKGQNNKLTAKGSVQMASLSNHPLALKALLEESRKLIGHPKENDWWKPVMKAFIRDNSEKVIENIKARNAGIASFRSKNGHGH